MKGETDLTIEEKKLVDAIDERELIDYCKELVEIPSVFGSEHRIAEKIARDLKSFGLETTSVPTEGCGPSIVGTYSHGSDPPTLIFNGHMDTVQVCQGWTRNPFSARVEDGKLYGLGSTDMKGGLAAIIMAAKTLASSKAKLNHGFAVHAVSDEEAWGRGTSSLIRRGFYEEPNVA